MRNFNLFGVVFAIAIGLLFSVTFVYPVILYAQEVDPMGFVNVIFSGPMAVMVGAIVGFTKLIRNTINLKGPFAIAVTVVVSIGYSLVQYNSEGMGMAILVGVVAALVSTVGFRLTKLFGKSANPEGIK